MIKDRYLVLFVEGEDDKRFFTSFFNNDPKIKYYEYSRKKNQDVRKYIQTIKKMPNFDYLYIADSDGKSCDERKNSIVEKVNICEKEKIIVVCYEIESWYLAGLSEDDKKKMKIKKDFKETNNLTKEYFQSLVPLQFTSEIDFMIEILKIYKKEIAIKNNLSFDTFNKKWHRLFALY